MKKETQGFIVVFESTPESGAYNGIRTFTSFKSEQDFNKFYTPKRQKMKCVIAKGVSREKALDLTKISPLIAYLQVAKEEALKYKQHFVRIFSMKLSAIIVMEVVKNGIDSKAIMMFFFSQTQNLAAIKKAMEKAKNFEALDLSVIENYITGRIEMIKQVSRR